MNEVLTFAAEMREQLGTGPSRALRRRGMVPVTIYGSGKKPISIAVKERDLTKHYRKPQYISQIIQFETDHGKFRVLPKAIDLNPITEIVCHADFVFLEHKIQKIEVPIVYINKENCTGIKRGGYFNIVRRSLTLLCPVDNLPRRIEIDIKDMLIGNSLKAEAALLPRGSKLINDPKLVIASIIGKKGKSTDISDPIDEENSKGKEESGVKVQTK